MYSLGTWFVSGICVHKEENDDDDDNNNNNNNDNNNKVTKYSIEIIHFVMRAEFFRAEMKVQ